MRGYQDYSIVIDESATADTQGNIRVTCPKCPPAKKQAVRSNGKGNLSVNLSKRAWHCFRCEWAGGLPDPDKTIFREREYERPVYDVKFQKQLPRIVTDYFASRKIPGEILTANMIGWHDEKKAIMFPVVREGQVVNIKYRKLDKTLWQTKGAESAPYGIDDIDKEMVVICEGEIDKLSFEAAGICALSLPNGASSLGFLADYEKLFLEIKQFVIAVDNDEVGQKAEQQLSRRLGRGKSKRIIWPEGCKDANDVLVKLGPEVLKTLVDNAEPYPVDGIYNLAEYDKELIDLYENGFQPGLNPFYCEDSPAFKNFSIEMGELTVVTGIPNHGKSSFLNWMLMNLIRRYSDLFGEKKRSEEVRVGIFSPESMPPAAYIAKSVGQFAKKPFEKQYSNRISKDELLDHSAFLNKYLYLLNPSLDSLDPEKILSMARALVLTRGVNVICLDPLNKFDHCKTDMGMSDNDYMAWFFNKWKFFATQYNCHVFIVAHPRKMERDKDGDYIPPGLYDICGSSNIANIIDNGITIWRKPAEENGEVYMYTLKIRNDWIGKIGATTFKFDLSTKRYLDLSEQINRGN